MASTRGAHWLLDPEITFLNHGSFGACPRSVLGRQQLLRTEIESRPVEWLARRVFGEIDAARSALARFLGTHAGAIAPVTNATTGVNAVLRSLALAPGDELLVTDHAYNACRNALDFVAGRASARVVEVEVPFPVTDPMEIVDRLTSAVTPRTRLALVDHVTSPTALVLPIETIVAELRERGVDTLVDGAHAPGMVPLELDALGAAYYVGNCHKWICAPKTAGFLFVRADRRDGVRPTTISHGANTRRAGRSRFHDEFDWVGTVDPTPFLCVPDALEAVAARIDGGWPAVMEHNRALALRGRRIVAEALGTDLPCPDTMIGSMASLPFPDAAHTEIGPDPFQKALYDRHAIEVPIFVWPRLPRRVLRLSAQLYNDDADYRRLAEAIGRELSDG